MVSPDERGEHQGRLHVGVRHQQQIAQALVRTHKFSHHRARNGERRGHLSPLKR